jgi:hypothetical protein
MVSGRRMTPASKILLLKGRVARWRMRDRECLKRLRVLSAMAEAAQRKRAKVLLRLYAAEKRLGGLI